MKQKSTNILEEMKTLCKTYWKNTANLRKTVSPRHKFQKSLDLLKIRNC